MLLTGRWLCAEEALRMKLVNRVVPQGRLFLDTERLAAKIAGQNPLTISYAKQAVVRGLDLALEQGLELEAELGRKLLAQSG